MGIFCNNFLELGDPNQKSFLEGVGGASPGYRTKGTHAFQTVRTNLINLINKVDHLNINKRPHLKGAVVWIGLVGVGSVPPIRVVVPVPVIGVHVALIRVTVEVGGCCVLRGFVGLGLLRHATLTSPLVRAQDGGSVLDLVRAQDLTDVTLCVEDHDVLKVHGLVFVAAVHADEEGREVR